MTTNRWAVSLFAILVICSAWWLWPVHPKVSPVDESEISDIIVQVSDANLSDQLDLSEDSVFSVSFLPNSPWPNDESRLIIVTLTPAGASYEASKSFNMMRCSTTSSVSVGLLQDGKQRQYSPPKPAPGDPRCYYYTALSNREIPFDGLCRLDISVAKTSDAKTGNYGQFSPMTSTCVFRHAVEVTR